MIHRVHRIIFIDMINVEKSSKNSRDDIDPVLLEKLELHCLHDRSKLENIALKFINPP